MPQWSVPRARTIPGRRLDCQTRGTSASYSANGTLPVFDRSVLTAQHPLNHKESVCWAGSGLGLGWARAGPGLGLVWAWAGPGLGLGWA